MPRPGPRPTEGFDRALERGDLTNAWFYAFEVSFVPLYKALWLTILIGQKRGATDDYQAVCRRFMVRFIREQQPKMEQIKRLPDALDVLADDMSAESPVARRAMFDLVERLRGDQDGPRPRSGR